jgi:hypothetical protein
VRARVAAAAALAAGLASAVACVDLFHSTDDAHGICELDASDPRCDAGGDAAPPDLCAPEAGVAQQRAVHACAWLAACDHPIGKNKTGQCIVNAVLAYDCDANPSRKPLGTAKAFWQCMQNANSCDDVGKCVFPQGVPNGCKAGGFLGCSQSAYDLDTRIDCVQPTDAGAQGENCAAYGQTCDSLDRDASNHDAICVNSNGQGRSCTGSGCVQGRWLSFCDDAGVDVGYDCADFGAGACTPSGASPACKPAGTVVCAATNDVVCTSGNVRAQGCVTGVQESVDCTPISGPGTCVPIEAGAPGTVPSDACRVADGGCTDDTCSGAALAACVRGRVVPIDCTSLGLRTCNPVATEEGAIAACTPP